MKRIPAVGALACTVCIVICLLSTGGWDLRVDAATANRITTGVARLPGDHDLTAADLAAGHEALVRRLGPLLEPGMLVGFCQEAETGVIRGPFYSNRVDVAVATGFDVQVDAMEVERDTTHAGAELKTGSLGVDLKSSKDGIVTELDRARLQQVSSVDDIIQEMARLDEPVRASFKDIYGLLLEDGLIAEDINVEDFFLKLVELGFMTREEVDGIFEQLTSNGIFLSERVDGIFEALDRLGIFLATMSSRLIEALNRLGIDMTLTSALFQSLLSHLGSLLQLTSAELDQLIHRLSVSAGLTSAQLEDALSHMSHAQEVDSDGYEQGVERKGVEFSIKLQRAELELWQAAQRSKAGPGDRLEYEIFCANSGVVDAERAVVIQVLPMGVTYKKKSAKGEKSSVIHLGDGVTCIAWRMKKKLKPDNDPKRLRYQAIVDLPEGQRRR